MFLEAFAELNIVGGLGVGWVWISLVVLSRRNGFGCRFSSVLKAIWM